MIVRRVAGPDGPGAAPHTACAARGTCCRAQVIHRDDLSYPRVANRTYVRVPSRARPTREEPDHGEEDLQGSSQRHPLGLKHSGVVQYSHDNKDPVVSQGQSTAKANEPSQLVVHRADGTIEYEYTYGDDPYPPPG